jgi:hypothetical protein
VKVNWGQIWLRHLVLVEEKVEIVGEVTDALHEVE